MFCYDKKTYTFVFEVLDILSLTLLIDFKEEVIAEFTCKVLKIN
jgi:hypothetical protein